MTRLIEACLTLEELAIIREALKEYEKKQRDKRNWKKANLAGMTRDYLLRTFKSGERF